MWLNLAKEELPKCGTPFANPGTDFVAGHFTHVTSAFINLAAMYAVYVVLQTSHMSMMLQVAEVRIYRFIKRQYTR